MKKSLLIPALCALLLIAAVFVFRTRSADSLVSGSEPAGVYFLYNDIGSTTSGVCPEFAPDDPEMAEVHAFLQDVSLRFDGFQGSRSGTALPCYRLTFFADPGETQATLTVTEEGRLYCGRTAYRVLSPDMGEFFSQLDALYALAEGS